MGFKFSLNPFKFPLSRKTVTQKSWAIVQNFNKKKNFRKLWRSSIDGLYHNFLSFYGCSMFCFLCSSFALNAISPILLHHLAIKCCLSLISGIFVSEFECQTLDLNLNGHFFHRIAYICLKKWSAEVHSYAARGDLMSLWIDLKFIWIMILRKRSMTKNHSKITWKSSENHPKIIRKLTTVIE